ncbi:hypothetical protein Tco_0058157 [Tanacetum coccineum]
MDYPNTCLCYMLYYFAIGKHFNLAYYIVNRMVSMTKSADITLPYGMLLTRLVEHIRVSHPHAFSDDLYLVDHVMIPLSERRVFKIMPGGKRPRLLTPIPTPSGSSESTFSSSHQEEENDPFESLKFLQRQLYLVDHVMIPLSERRFFKIMLGGKRPRIPTPIPTPSGSSESTSSSSHQEEENDLVNNFTLKLIPYINQLPPIEGGESHEFKQTKGMFKCFGHFLSNLGKKKK